MVKAVLTSVADGGGRVGQESGIHDVGYADERETFYTEWKISGGEKLRVIPVVLEVCAAVWFKIESCQPSGSIVFWDDGYEKLSMSRRDLGMSRLEIMKKCKQKKREVTGGVTGEALAQVAQVEVSIGVPEVRGGPRTCGGKTKEARTRRRNVLRKETGNCGKKKMR